MPACLQVSSNAVLRKFPMIAKVAPENCNRANLKLYRQHVGRLGINGRPSKHADDAEANNGAPVNRWKGIN